MIVGYCYIVGDILHRGHIRHLKNCRALCNKLICGVLSEKAVMEKKPKPILSLNERVEMVQIYVDAVVAQDQYSPTKNCKLIEPDILFESDSHETHGDNGGRKIFVMPYYPNQSSTKIKEAIKNACNTPTGSSR